MARSTIPAPYRRFQLLLAVTGAALLALPAAAQEQTFEETTSVVVVEVPVQVVDRDGEPVRGLTADNFEIFEERTRREIVSFDVVDRARISVSTAQRPGAIPPSARRYFLFLFDLSFSDPSSTLKAREAARGILDRLHPSDLTAVATFSLLRGAEMVVGFTSDRRQTTLAIDTLGAPQLVDRSPDPLGVLMGKVDTGLRQAATPSGDLGAGSERQSGLDFDQEVAEYLRDLEASTSRFDRRTQEIRVQQMTASMADLAGLMRAVDGRKHVVYLSEGFDSRLLLGEGGADVETSSAIESGQLWTVDTDTMFGSGQMQNRLEDMLEAFRRADCAIEAVDIGGLRATGEGPAPANGQEGLFTMARGTGGELYRNFNDLGEAMGSLLERTSVTYVLAFQPDDLAPTGEYRKLRVRLRDAPRGARVVHRPGYFAPRPAEELSPQERRLELASQVLAGRVGGGVEVSVLAVPFRVPGGQPSVPVLIEIGGESLLGRLQTGETAAEIFVYALDAQGGVADYFNQTLGLDLAKLGEKIRQSGVKLFGRLDLDPGRYDLRVLVRNAATGATGLDVVPIQVPAFGSDELVVLPPLVPEGLDRWLMVRQAPGADDRSLPYPFFLNEGESFVPAARPVVVGGRPVNVGIFAYNVGEGDVTLNAQVLGAEGNVVLGQQLPVYQRTQPEADGPTRLLTALQLAGVPAGEYTLSVGVFDNVGGRRDLASIPIRVEPGEGGGVPAVLADAPGAGADAGASAGFTVPALPPSYQPSARDSVRIPVLRTAYREALEQLAGGLEAEATAALVGLEQAERSATDDVLLEALARAERTVAEQLAGEDPDALIPVILLHESAYIHYRDRQQRLLARHSRSVVRDLAELYVDAGGSPTSVAAGAFTSLGGSLQQAGLTSSANSLFQRALDLQPDNEGALLSLAVYYEKVGQYDTAVDYLEKLTRAHPDNAEGWLRLGINLQRVGKQAQGREWLEKALGEGAAAWVRSLAYQELALAEVAAGNLRRAEELLRQGLDHLPSDQRLMLQLAHVLDRRGHSHAAVALLEQIEGDSGGAGESPRYLYNRWPIQVIESGRRQLASSASSRLPVLAKVISGLNNGETAR